MSRRRYWLIAAARDDRRAAAYVIDEYKHAGKQVRELTHTALTALAAYETGRRERITVVPIDRDKFITQCRERKIDYAISEHIFGAIYVDFRLLDEDTYKRMMNMISSVITQDHISTDTDIKFGSTARLTPEVQKIRIR